MPKKPHLSKGPASLHAATSEIIREFGDDYGHGGLVSVRLVEDEGRPVRVEVYRTDGEVSVLAAPADIAAAIGESDAAELRRLLDAKYPPMGTKAVSLAPAQWKVLAEALGDAIAYRTDSGEGSEDELDQAAAARFEELAEALGIEVD